MNIESVEEIEDGSFKVVIAGKKMFVPNDMSNLHRAAVQKWIDAGNVPDPAPLPPSDPPLPEQIIKRRGMDKVIDDLFKRIVELENR